MRGNVGRCVWRLCRTLEPLSDFLISGRGQMHWVLGSNVALPVTPIWDTSIIRVFRHLLCIRGHVGAFGAGLGEDSNPCHICACLLKGRNLPRDKRGLRRVIGNARRQDHVLTLPISFRTGGDVVIFPPWRSANRAIHVRIKRRRTRCSLEAALGNEPPGVTVSRRVNRRRWCGRRTDPARLRFRPPFHAESVLSMRTDPPGLSPRPAVDGGAADAVGRPTPSPGPVGDLLCGWRSIQIRFCRSIGA